MPVDKDTLPNVNKLFSKKVEILPYGTVSLHPSLF